jgi:serine/threonine-protein kinase RsbW
MRTIADNLVHTTDIDGSGGQDGTGLAQAQPGTAASGQREARATTPAQAAAQSASTARGSALRDAVTVKMPADGAYLSVLRTATAGLAARLDFTLDEIEDMRIAVDEACAMLLSQAIPGSTLNCDFALDRDAITISVSVRCLAPRVPSNDTFAWTVLTALAGDVEALVGPGDMLTIVLRKCRDSSRSV